MFHVPNALEVWHNGVSVNWWNKALQGLGFMSRSSTPIPTPLRIADRRGKIQSTPYLGRHKNNILGIWALFALATKCTLFTDVIVGATMGLLQEEWKQIPSYGGTWSNDKYRGAECRVAKNNRFDFSTWKSPSVAESYLSDSSYPTLSASDVSRRRPNNTSLAPGIVKTAKWLQWFLLDQWFLIALGILILISSQAQVPQSGQEIKKSIVTYLAVSLIFFITGCNLPTRDLIENCSRWRLHLFVQIQCFLLTSATTFGVASMCGMDRDFMDPWLLIGLIFMGCVPTTISSNVVMTKQANGNEALTVVQSTCSNVLGPVIAPVLISMYTSTGSWYTDVLPQNSGGYTEIYRRVFEQLGVTLFLPMIAGQVVQNVFPKTTVRVLSDWKFGKLSSVALLAVIWQTYDQAFKSGAFASVKGDNLVFLIFISIALWVFWLAVSFITSILWLSKADTISVAYCVPAKTPAMGVPLSTVLFLGLTEINESKLQIPMVVYQGFQVALGSLITMAFRRWTETKSEKTNDAVERGIE